MVLQCGHEFIGFINDFDEGPSILGTYRQICRHYSPADYDIVMAIGYKHQPARWSIYQKIKADHYQVPSLIHPRAYVRNPEAIGEGCIIMAGAAIDIGAKLEPLVALGLGVVIDHDSLIMSNTLIASNATICGHVTVGSGCFIGAGAVVVDHVHVPAGSFVKAGSVFKRLPE